MSLGELALKAVIKSGKYQDIINRALSGIGYEVVSSKYFNALEEASSISVCEYGDCDGFYEGRNETPFNCKMIYSCVECDTSFCDAHVQDSGMKQSKIRGYVCKDCMDSDDKDDSQEED